LGGHDFSRAANSEKSPRLQPLRNDLGAAAKAPLVTPVLDAVSS